MEITPLARLLHQGRTELLQRLPRGAGVFCSVGCAGSWYFDWIEQNCGPIGRHVGIELYAPRPAELPANAEWIANSAADMHDLADGSVDVLFSGQNIEHLFPRDVPQFFREANRVLKPGGILCVDSPNRHLATRLRFRFHEHTLEFSPGEAVSLTRAAGFDVEECWGIWRCQDREGLMPIVPPPGDEARTARRLAEAQAHPEDSLLWWIVARKVGAPQAELGWFAADLFLREMPAFARSRTIAERGTLRSAWGTEVVLEVAPAEAGQVFSGPLMPLQPGDYRAEFLVQPLGPGGHMTMEVTSAFGATVHASATLHFECPSDGWMSVPMRFVVTDYTTAVEARLRTHGAHALVRLGGQILPWR